MANYIEKLVKLAKSLGLESIVDDTGLIDTEYEQSVSFRVQKLSAMEIEDLKMSIAHVMGKRKHMISDNTADKGDRVYMLTVYLFKSKKALSKKVRPKENDLEDRLKADLLKDMEEEIASVLTDSDSQKKVYTQKQVRAFIKKNKNKLRAAVDEMFHTYKRDGELNELETRENDWIREFLYKHVTVPTIDDSEEIERQRRLKAAKSAAVRKTQPKSPKVSPKKAGKKVYKAVIQPKFYALFYVDVGSDDLHYELDRMFRGLYTTREFAKHAFAELHTAMEEDVDEIYPNGTDQDPVVDDDLLRKHGYKIMEVTVDK